MGQIKIIEHEPESINETGIVEATKFPKIINMPKDKALKRIYDQLVKIAFRTGRKNAFKDMETTTIATNDLYEMIISKYQWVTLPELFKIFGWGSAGELGPVVSLALPELCTWFRTYYAEFRTKALAKHHNTMVRPILSAKESETKQAQLREMIATENEKARKDTKRKIISYLKTKNKADLKPVTQLQASYWYDFLTSLKIVVCAEPEKLEIFNDCKARIIAGGSYSGELKDLEWTAFKAVKLNATGKIVTVDKKNKYMIRCRSECKAIAFGRWVESVVEFGYWKELLK